MAAEQNLELPFSFSTNFLRDHAGHLITDPRAAITELIANSYDAGATAVAITWPDGTEGPFVVSDNGDERRRVQSALEDPFVSATR